MKEFTKEELYEIAFRIGEMLYADLDIMDEEKKALENAMEIISPEYVADREQDEREAQEFFESMTPEQLAEYAKSFDPEPESRKEAAIESIEDIRTLKEMEQYSDIYAWARDKAAENDAYWGTDLNAEKINKLNALKGLSIRIAELEPDIKYEWFPFSNNNRHGSVQLVTGLLGFFSVDKRVLDLLSEMYRISDIVNMNVGIDDGQTILTTFSIRDMWNNHGSVYDRKE